jgi:hypothetical protein
MAGAKEFDRILTAAAKAALTPTGFWRKGRSRLWLADNGFWLNVVGFRPSPWSAFVKSSDLDVSPHWLWGVHDFLSLDDLQTDVRSHIEFENPAQFEPLALKQAADAAAGSLRLRSRFGTISATAKDLMAYAESLREEGRPGGWPAYHAAVSAGICGDAAASRSLFEAAIESFAGLASEKYAPKIEQMRSVVNDRGAFRSLMEERVNARRVTFGLQPRTNVFAL